MIGCYTVLNRFRNASIDRNFMSVNIFLQRLKEPKTINFKIHTTALERVVRPRLDNNLSSLFAMSLCDKDKKGIEKITFIQIQDILHDDCSVSSNPIDANFPLDFDILSDISLVFTEGDANFNISFWSAFVNIRFTCFEFFLKSIGFNYY